MATTITYLKLVVIEETLSTEITLAKFAYAFWNHAVGTSCREYGVHLFIHTVEGLLIQ
jgi:hypothetical protein